MSEGYDYANLVSNPVDGIPPGTTLPLSEFPDELRCPWCPDDPKVFKNENGLRGHAHGKHGVRWELPVRESKPNAAPYALMQLPKDRVTLMPWHMIGIAMHDLYGLSWEAVGEKLGRGGTVLSQIGLSPAGTAFRERLMELAKTPEAVALLLMKANSINVTADFFAALEWAKEARDYAAVHRMTKDLLSMMGAEERQAEDDRRGGMELHVHLDARDLEVPFVTSTSKVLEAEVIDE